MDMDETASDAAIRELEEETGLVVSQVSQIGAYSDVQRDPRGRVVTVAFFASVATASKLAASDDAADAQWFSLDQLPELAFDHQQIIADAKQKFIVVN